MKIRLILFLATIALSLHAQTSLLEQLAGEWHFVASNEGEQVAPGVYRAGVDDFVFTATASADGQSLECHADCLYKAEGGAEYPAQWQIVVEQNDQGQHRIGWVLSADNPCFTAQHEGNNIYLLADVIDEQSGLSSFQPMTFWSSWNTEVATSYGLSNIDLMARTLYAVLSPAVPYDGSKSYLEAWTSPRIQRSAYETAVQTISRESSTALRQCFTLSGQRLSQPRRGLNIVGGRKIVVR
jgi:hypothetical protein